MGPRLFRRGNPSLLFSFSYSPVLQWGHVFSDVEMFMDPVPRLFQERLQWGHVFSDVEISACIARMMSASMLQWGHVFSDVEIFLSSCALLGRSPASMGPRLFRRGNDDVSIYGGPRAPASMGPRLFRRGNRRINQMSNVERGCFNGATSFQTWK